MIVCITTKSLYEESFRTSDHDEKSKEKYTRTDPTGRKEFDHVSHSILERIERDEKQNDKHNNCVGNFQIAHSHSKRASLD